LRTHCVRPRGETRNCLPFSSIRLTAVEYSFPDFLPLTSRRYMNDGANPNPAKSPKTRLNSFSPDEGARYSRSDGIGVIVLRTGILAPAS
jgi:hypothetical protein